MTEETLISVEGTHDRATIGSYFRRFADGLDSGGSVTFSTDTDDVSLTVPEMSELEIEVERETEDDKTEYEIEFEVEWSTEEEAEADESVLKIEGESETAGGQETIDEAVDEAEGGSDAEMEPPNPPYGRSEVDAAEDDEGSQHVDKKHEDR